MHPLMKLLHVTCDGLNLLVETNSPRLDGRRVHVLSQMADALEYLHGQGYLHRDVCPRNVMVTQAGQVKLIDFGLTIPYTPEFCKPGNRTGTLQYMAPELLRREPIDERIDIFAFGVLAFEFLTGRLPYDATNSTTMALQRINTEPLDPAVVTPKLSDELCGILRQLTARKRDQRWASMSTLANALRSVPPKRRRG